VTQNQAIRTNGADLVIAAKAAKAANAAVAINTGKSDIMDDLLNVVANAEKVHTDQIGRLVHIMDNSSDSAMATYTRLSAQAGRRGHKLPEFGQWSRKWANWEATVILTSLTAIAR
jgi:hypothetical protein